MKYYQKLGLLLFIFGIFGYYNGEMANYIYLIEESIGVVLFLWE